ncbi:MAG: hypothetical protein LIO85_05600 [Rikenellaceae bacterium]|nr:hypothetical protein [Rikenellaceae bacterium]
MAVRVDLTLRLTDAQFADFKHIRFDNVPDRLYIFPETDNSASVTNNLQYDAVAGNAGYSSEPGNITTLTSGDYAVEITYPRILLPEVWFTPESDKDCAVVLTACFATEDYPALIGIDRPDDYTLPRNVYYDVSATVAVNDAEIDIAIAAQDWDDKLVDDRTNRSLYVSAVEATINERNMARIYFWTDQQDVYIEELDGSDLPVDEVFYGLTGSNPENFHFDGSTGEGWFDIMTDRAAARVSADGTTRTHKIYLNAGGGKFTREVTVNVNIPSSDFAAYNYVGAFWRSDQKGERVIAMANTGDWTAAVDGAPGWVVLAPGKSLDPGLWADGTEPGDAESWPVEGSATSVSGTGNIYFRIGLTGENPDPSAPRYAKVVVNGTHEIFIRQGEAADYLMRPDDNATALSGNRPLAAKYSPYNLTSREFIEGTKTGGTTIANHTLFTGIRQGVFTEYPTQAGAYFQHMDQGGNYAYHPNNPEGSMQISGWSSVTDFTTYWNTWESSRETCPPGYRRLTDGVTDAVVGSPAIAASEQRQSLWLNPQTGTTSDTDNSRWGYYADGFFDRRTIETSTAYTAFDNSAVCIETNDYRAAYVGRLFFNPDTNASLFFPACGNRHYSSSQIYSSGDIGYYWTSSTNSTEYGWGLLVNQTDAYQNNAARRSNGISIRCVVD